MPIQFHGLWIQRFQHTIEHRAVRVGSAEKPLCFGLFMAENSRPFTACLSFFHGPAEHPIAVP